MGAVAGFSMTCERARGVPPPVLHPLPWHTSMRASTTLTDSFLSVPHTPPPPDTRLQVSDQATSVHVGSTGTAFNTGKGIPHPSTPPQRTSPPCLRAILHTQTEGELGEYQAEVIFYTNSYSHTQRDSVTPWCISGSAEGMTHGIMAAVVSSFPT